MYMNIVDKSINKDTYIHTLLNNRNNFVDNRISIIY